MRFGLDKNAVLVFKRFGMGDAPEDLQQLLASKFLGLINGASAIPGKVLFYTDGVKLACEDSPVLDQLRALEAKGVELILCQTCLDYFGLSDHVAVGVVGGMPDIIEAMQKAGKVISL